jgi:hypothetical protein
MAAFGMLFHVAHVDVGGIEAAGGLQIKAVPPALVIRDCHGTPLSWHGNSIARMAKKRRIHQWSN